MSDLKRLPLHDAHAAAGARFAPFAGYEMPVRYTTIKAEHHAVRQQAGMFDVSHMGEVFVRGAKALERVDGLVANDLRSMAVGQAKYTVMCTESGGIVDDLIVYRLAEDEVLICVNAANRAKDFAWICGHIADDVDVVDESDDWFQLAVQGPNALALLADAGLDTGAYKPFRAGRTAFAGATVVAARTGYTGEDGFELYGPAERANDVFDAIVSAGAPHGLVLAGLGARDTLRLEARLALYGNDITEETDPFEAGLGWTVKLDGADFVGRDALLEKKAAGPSRRLRGLMLDGRGVLRAGYPVFAGDTQVGTTTSGGVAPSLNDRSIALAYIDIAHANDARLEVEVRGRRLPVDVTRKPFYTRPS